MWNLSSVALRAHHSLESLAHTAKAEMQARNVFMVETPGDGVFGESEEKCPPRVQVCVTIPQTGREAL